MPLAGAIEWVEVDGAESRHLVHVLRARIGDHVLVFDGSGREAIGAVERVSAGRVVLSIQEQWERAAKPYRIGLIQALVKGKAMDLVLQKGTELGMDYLKPVAAERSEVRLAGNRARQRLEKWKSTVIESCKQSGNSFLPKVMPVTSLADALADIPQGAARLHASLESAALPLREACRGYRERFKKRPLESVLMVGPEGDFTPAELEQIRAARFVPVTLGPNVLRSETAAIAGLAILEETLRHFDEGGGP